MKIEINSLPLIMLTLIQRYQYSLLAILAGASLPLAFAPFFIWPLAIISPAILLFIIDKKLSSTLSNRNTIQSQKQSNTLNNESRKGKSSSVVKLGALYWLGFYLSGVSWIYVSIHVYGYTPAPIAAFLAFLFATGLALVNSLQTWIYYRINAHRYYIVSFAASWVLMEWFRTWFLSGFPWLLNGYAFIDSPLASYAPIGGVYFLSFISMVCASLLFFMSKGLINKTVDKRLFVISGLSLVLIFGGASLLKHHNWVTVNFNQAINFHLIQGNISQHDKWLPEKNEEILKTYHKMISHSLSHIGLQKKEEEFNTEKTRHTPSVIVLPEAAMPTIQSNLDWFFKAIASDAKKINTTLISGIFYDDVNYHINHQDIYNSVIAMGDGKGLYHKQKLVPFGEYVPLETLIRGLIPFFDLPFSSFARGNYGQKGLYASNVHISPFICYEILYPELVRDHGASSDILLTISNDAWFGNSTGPKQHFQMARMRALELGKYLVRTANTGTTAIVNHRGVVTNRLARNQQNTLIASAYTTSGYTPYAKWGSLPLILLSTTILLFCLGRKLFIKEST